MASDSKMAPNKPNMAHVLPLMEDGVVQDVQLIQKPFTTWSAMCTGASVTNTAIAIFLTLGGIASYGGPVLLVWGFLVMAVVGLAAAFSLAELASALPDPGGQYIWVAVLSPPGPRRFLSYITAIFSWGGAVATGASVCVLAPNFLFELGTLLNPDFVPHRWQNFLAYHAVNIVMLIPSCFEHALPKLTKSILTFTMLLLLGSFIALFAAPHSQLQPWDTVFTKLTNISGWNNGVAVFIGVNGLNWGFSCLDALVHVSEEIADPRKNVPKALLLTILVGVVTGLPIALAIAYNVPDLETYTSSMAMIYTIFGNSNTAAVVFQVLLVISAVGAMWGIHVWQSRLAWTIGINKGFPFSRYLAQVAGAPFHTPIWALLWSAMFTSLLGFLYLASEAAFNSLVSAGILLQYASYAIPIILLLLRGRSNFERGPFWYPRLGLLANVIFLCWAPTALVFYSFPYVMPVTAGDMNYVSVVLAIFLVSSIILWFTYAKRHFSFPQLG